MSQNKDSDKGPVVLKLLDYLPEKKNKTEIGEYGVSSPDLREIADRVYESEDDIKEMFVQMYISFNDELHDCSLTDRGFNLYTEDDKYMYVFTVIKKE